MRPALFSLLLLGLAACQSETDSTTDETATAEPDTAAAETAALAEADLAVATLAPLDSSGVSGTVEFRRIGDATEVRYAFAGLPPGEHGFHLHENASCEPADTADDPDTDPNPGGAAGGHFNPTASPHGAPGLPMTGRHAGDFGNVTAGPDGRAEGIAIDSVLTFEGPTALVGHAVIVHENRDDLESQPGGASGARLACGVAQAGPAQAGPAR
jgi:Cu-Zn family superoxide dismutase